MKKMIFKKILITFVIINIMCGCNSSSVKDNDDQQQDTALAKRRAARAVADSSNLDDIRPMK